ncbi:MAG: hypothetical protein WCC58_01775 [Burkholderiales bacterium]
MTKHQHGLFNDLEQLERVQRERRSGLRYISAAGLFPLVGCSSNNGSAAAAVSRATRSPTSTPTAFWHSFLAILLALNLLFICCLRVEVNSFARVAVRE